MSYIVKNERGVTKGAISIVVQPRVGEKILYSGSEESCEKNYSAFERRVCVGEGESFRIHAANGAYLFSVRVTSDGPEIFHSRSFTRLGSEHAQKVELFPWLKKKEVA